VLKDTLFAVQSATRKIENADSFDAIAQLEADCREIADRIRSLKAEFEAMQPPSSWERSRMRKHNQLAEKTFSHWADTSNELRNDVEAGGVPPHVRTKLISTLDDLDAARNDAWSMFAATFTE
jgi:hypothetical protein